MNLRVFLGANVFLGLLVLGLFVQNKSQNSKIEDQSLRIQQLHQRLDSFGTRAPTSVSITKELCSDFGGASWDDRTKRCSLSASSPELERRVAALEGRSGIEPRKEAPKVAVIEPPKITAAAPPSTQLPWRPNAKPAAHERDYLQVRGTLLGESVDLVGPTGKRECVYPKGAGGCEIGSDGISRATCRQGRKVQVYQGPGRVKGFTRTVYRCVQS